MRVAASTVKADRCELLAEAERTAEPQLVSVNVVSMPPT